MLSSCPSSRYWHPLSFSDAHQISVHLDSVDVPHHLGLCQRGHSSQILEKAVRHVLVELVQMGLHLAFEVFDGLHDALGTFSHVFLELEFFFQIFLLVKLNVSGLKEMGFDIDVALNASFGDLPL